MGRAAGREPVSVDTDCHVASITLCRGDTGNRLAPDLLESLSGALSAANAEADVRVVVLRSNGPAFSLGMDIEALAGALVTGGEDKTGQIAEAITLYTDVLTLITEMPKPVLCLVNGEVRAGGVGLVCASDIVCATETSTFALTEVLFGLIPANVLPFLLSERIPPQRARYLVLSAKTMDAREAKDAGIVDEVLSGDKPEKDARGLVRQLLRGGPSAMAEAKCYILAAGTSRTRETLQAARDTLLRLVKSEEFLGAMRAMSEGFTPDWYVRYKPEHDLVGEEP